MADDNIDRWQGKVDAKLDTICDRLSGISTWMSHHEELDGERFGKLELMMDHDKAQRSQIKKLQDTILGNGQEGLLVKTDRNTRNLAAYNKVTWLLAGAVVAGLVTALVALL